MNVYEALSFMIGFGILIATIMSKEALIKSLSDFILVFLFNARNQSTRIASYLRRLMRSIG
ncbi:putative holin-like toxin [uncultured Dialister sp.]|uniref:putative holin-like toxin n=1 Tax=uncultured Dialister sp. TaxID=278064 RepID=UPI0034A516A9